MKRRRATWPKAVGVEGDLRERIKAEGSITANGALLCLTTVRHYLSVKEACFRIREENDYEGGVEGAAVMQLEPRARQLSPEPRLPPVMTRHLPPQSTDTMLPSDSVSGIKPISDKMQPQNQRQALHAYSMANNGIISRSIIKTKKSWPPANCSMSGRRTAAPAACGCARTKETGPVPAASRPTAASVRRTAGRPEKCCSLRRSTPHGRSCQQRLSEAVAPCPGNQRLPAVSGPPCHLRRGP